MIRRRLAGIVLTLAVVLGAPAAAEPGPWKGEFTFSDTVQRLPSIRELEFTVDDNGDVVGTARMRDPGDGSAGMAGQLTGKLDREKMELTATVEPAGDLARMIGADLAQLMTVRLKLRADLATGRWTNMHLALEGDGTISTADPACVQALFATGEGDGTCPSYDAAATWKAEGEVPPAVFSALNGKPPAQQGEKLPISDEEFYHLLMWAILAALATMIGGALGAVIGAAAANLGSGQPWWVVLDMFDPASLDGEPPQLPWLSLSSDELNQDAAAAARLYRRPDGSVDLDGMRRYFQEVYGLPPGGGRPPWMDEETYLATQALADMAVRRASQINYMDEAGIEIPDALFMPDLPPDDPPPSADGDEAPELPDLPPGQDYYDETHYARLLQLQSDNNNFPDDQHERDILDLAERAAKTGIIDLSQLEALEAASEAGAARRANQTWNDNAYMRSGRQQDLDERRAEGRAEISKAARENWIYQQSLLALGRLRAGIELVDDKEVSDRAYDLDKLYNEDGTLNLDYYARLRQALRNRLAIEAEAPEHTLGGNSTLELAAEAYVERLESTSTNFVQRLLFGLASGGLSEIVFQTYGGVKKLKENVDAAVDKGKPVPTFEQALALWGQHMAEENLPINTLNNLRKARTQWIKREEITVTETDLVLGVVADFFSGKDVAGTVGAGKAGRRFLEDTMESSSLRRIDGAVEKLSARGDAAYRAAGEKLGFDMDAAPPGRLSARRAAERFDEGRMEQDTRDMIRDVKDSGVTKTADDAHASGREGGRKKVEAFQRAVEELETAKATGRMSESHRAALEQKVLDATQEIQADKHAMHALDDLPRDTSGRNPTLGRFTAEMKDAYGRANLGSRERVAAEAGVNLRDVRIVEISNIKGKPDASLGSRPAAPDHIGLASTPKPDGSMVGSRGVRTEGPDLAQGTRVGLDAPLDPKKAPGPPPAPDKLSMDRDLTMVMRSIENGKEVWRDIPAATTARIYNEELWKAFKGSDPPPRGKLAAASVDFKDTHLSPDEIVGSVHAIKDVDKWAKRMDQATTDKQHPEAYGGGRMDLDTSTKDTHRGRDLRDAAATARTVEYKVNHWTKEADALDKAAAERGQASTLAQDAKLANAYREQAQAWREEGQRQLVKQYKNMVLTRTEAMASIGNAPGATIPRSLAEQVAVLQQVQRGGLTPAQAEAVLQRMGGSTERVAGQMSSYIEGLQAVRRPPPPPPRVQIRGEEEERSPHGREEGPHGRQEAPRGRRR